MNVEHDREGSRFVVREAEGRGELVYVPAESGVLDFVHTEVDRALRGRGVAEALAEAAFAYAREGGHKVVPSCPFVRKWLEKHPEQSDLVQS